MLNILITIIIVFKTETPAEIEQWRAARRLNFPGRKKEKEEVESRATFTTEEEEEGEIMEEIIISSVEMKKGSEPDTTLIAIQPLDENMKPSKKRKKKNKEKQEAKKAKHVSTSGLLQKLLQKERVVDRTEMLQAIQYIVAHHFLQ